MKRAVVIGASIAGSLAARVLSDHADEVVIIERDDPGDGTEARKAVPQGRHGHALLNRGLDGIERWFPGITDELVAGGAKIGDAGWNFRWWQDGQARAQVKTGLVGVLMTRPYLEATVRSRTLALDNVRLERTNGVGLSTTSQSIDGVLVANSGDGASKRIAADLVVDCTGRSTRLPEWLGDIGFEAPPVEEVKVQIGYATRLFESDGKTLADGSVGLACLPVAPHYDRGCFVFSVEGGRWLVTVAGAGDARPTSDIESFTNSCITLGAPPLAAMVKNAKPLGDVTTHKYQASLRRDFHRLRAFPKGLLAAGDVIASFNPIYGQGMTCATAHVQELEAELRANGKSVDAARYFKRVSKITNLAWTTSVTEDFRRPDATGKRPRGTAITHKLGDLYAKGSITDPALHRRFLHVLQMKAPPASLLHPAALPRLARAALKRKR